MRGHRASNSVRLKLIPPRTWPSSSPGGTFALAVCLPPVCTGLGENPTEGDCGRPGTSVSPRCIGDPGSGAGGGLQAPGNAHPHALPPRPFSSTPSPSAPYPLANEWNTISVFIWFIVRLPLLEWECCEGSNLPRSCFACFPQSLEQSLAHT